MPYWAVEVWSSGGGTIAVVVEAKDSIEAKWKGLLLMYQKGIYTKADPSVDVKEVKCIEDSILNPSARPISDKQT